MTHRKECRNTKMADFFKSADYFCEKISVGVGGSEDPAMLGAAFDALQEAVTKFKDELTKRGELECRPELEEEIRYVEFPLEKLGEYFSRRPDSEEERMTARIFASFLRDKVNELADSAKEFDEEYQTDLASG